MSRPERQIATQHAATFAGALVISARLHADAEAIVVPGARWTYAELLRRGLAVASALRGAGLKRGDRIGVLLENGPEFVELLAGAALLGVVPILLSDITQSYYLGVRLPSLDVHAFFVSRSQRLDFIDMIEGAWEIAAREAGDSNNRLWVVGDASDSGYPSYSDFVAAAADESVSILADIESMAPTDPFVIVFTSGLTGIPKTCRLNHLAVLGKANPLAQRFGLTSRSRLWMPTPMFQIGFVQPFVTALSIGACVVAMHRFDAAQALKLLRSERVTHAYPIYLSYWVPIIYQMDFRPSNFPALSHVVVVGPIGMLRRVQRALPQSTVMTTYGSAEEGGAFCLPSANDPAGVRLGSVGRPYPGYEVRIVDPVTGRLCAEDETGEIQVRGSGIPSPEEQDEFGSKFTADGWLQTSDLGSLSKDGVLTFQGRVAEMLSIGGKNVSAIAIESVLSEHPAVAVAQVIAAPDEVSGAVAAAFVELRPGYEIEPSELVEFCAARMAPELVPRYVRFVTDWPTSASKIYKPSLTELGLGPRLRS